MSRSGFYDWHGRPPSARAEANTLLLKQITEIHEQSRGTCGWPRVHTELVLGLGVEVKQAGRPAHACRRRARRLPAADPARPTRAATEGDLLHREFAVDTQDRLWLTDLTKHPTSEGKLYRCAVLDTYSRRILAWSIVHHMRIGFVLDPIGMAILRRRVAAIATPSTRSCIPTTAPSSSRLVVRATLVGAGLLPSKGTIGDCYDNSMMESFWATPATRGSRLSRHLGNVIQALPTPSSNV